MNHVNDRWLRRLNYFYAAVDILLIIGGIASHILFHANQHHWGFVPLAFGVISIHLIYALVIYPFYQKKNNWQATLVSQILFDFIFATIVNTSNQTNFYIRGAWIFTAGLSSMLGVALLTFEVAIDMSMNIFTITGVITRSAAGPNTEWVLSCGVAASAILGWLYMRRHYVRPDYYATDKLSVNLAREKSISSIVIRSITDGIIVFDTNNKISLINPAAATLTEWGATEAFGIDVHLVVKLADQKGKPLPDGTDYFQAVLTNKKQINQTVLLTGRQNKTAIVSMAIAPILVSAESEVSGGVVVFRDVTKQYQEEQQRADFISTASHEMRTPVAAIEGYLSLALNDKVSTIDSKARDFLIKAHESTEHLGKLFQDLLTSAKAEDGRLSNHPVVVEVGGLLEQLTDGLRFAAQKKNLAVEFTTSTNDLIDASKPVDATNSFGKTKVVRPLYYVKADPDRLREVITNLFDNAVKYTDEGKISLGLTGDMEFVQFYVRDTGAGISADDVPHLFQKFYRIDNSVTRTVGGTGLGLFICRKIVELYHGRIWADSKLGAGSTFYINLPRLTIQQAEQMKASEIAAQSLPGPTGTLTSS